MEETNRNGRRKLFIRMTRIRRERVAGRTLAELIFGIILVSAVLAVIGGIFLPGRWFFLAGLLVGAVAAILLVINMYDTIDAALNMTEKRARSYGSLHGVLRILATGVMLGVAVWIDVYAFVGAALGVASLKVSGLLHMPIAKLFAVFLPEEEEKKDGIVYHTGAPSGMTQSGKVSRTLPPGISDEEEL